MWDLIMVAWIAKVEIDTASNVVPFTDKMPELEYVRSFDSFRECDKHMKGLEQSIDKSYMCLEKPIPQPKN